MLKLMLIEQNGIREVHFPFSQFKFCLTLCFVAQLYATHHTKMDLIKYFINSMSKDAVYATF